MIITKQRVLNAFSSHIGRKKGIRAKNLVAEITGNWAERLFGAERQLRHIIVELRKEGHHICGSPSTGYFIAENEKELNETCEFLYHRAMTSLEQISKMKKTSLPDLRGQLRLPN